MLQQSEDNSVDASASSSSSSTPIPNLQWFIMPETVLITDANLIIQTTITPNTKSFNQSLKGQPFLKLVQDDEVQVICDMVKKTQIGDGSPVTENIVRNRFMNDITYKLNPVLDVSGNIVQYLITRTMSSTPKESLPTRYMERKHSGGKGGVNTTHSHDTEVYPKLSVGNDKILSKFIKLVEKVEPSVAAAIWLSDRSTFSTLHLVAFPTISELIGIKVPYNKKLLDRDKHDITPTSISSAHNYLQTPELVQKLKDHNLTTQCITQLYTSTQTFTGLLVFYGSNDFQPPPILKSLVTDAAALAESVISLEYDNQASKKIIEEQLLADDNLEKNITLIVDQNGYLQHLTNTVCALLGIDTEENMKCEKIENLIDEKDRQRVTSAVTKTKQNPKIVRYVDCVEFHPRTANTETKPNESVFENDSFYLDLKIQGRWDDPAISGCLIRGRDVSPKAISDRQALESQKSLAMTNNSLNEGLIRTDREGIIEYVNLAFIKLIGMDEWVLRSRPRSPTASDPAAPEQQSFSSSASESTGTEDEDQNVSLMSTLVGTPIDELLQLIQVLITEKPTSHGSRDSYSLHSASTEDAPSKGTSSANAQPLKNTGSTASRSSSPVVPENMSESILDAKLDSATNTDDDLFEEGLQYKTALVDMKGMIKRTVASKETMTLSDTTYQLHCSEELYSDVLKQDMLDIVNFQLGEPDLGRNIGYLIRRGGHTAVVAVEVSVNPLQQITYKRSKARALSNNSDGVVLVFRNMTDVMRTQAANRLLADKSRWISVITHEMRSLVNGIIGMLDLVKTTNLSDEQRGLVDCMEVSTNALICLVSNTLDHSRLEAGKVTLEYLPFNMKERLHIVVELMNMMAKSKNVEFCADIDDTIPEVLHSDFNRLFQILLNLISNAIKFSSHKRKRSKQGQVKLIVRCMEGEDKVGPIHSSPDTSRTSQQSSKQLTPPPSPQPPNQKMVQLKFVVEDNGIGISPRNKEKLFREFGQAEVSISRRYGGSGMGLFICKQLVRLFDGQIGCESTPGKGSQFWFTAWFQSYENNSTPTLDNNNNNYFSMEQAMMVNNNYEESASSSNVGESTDSGSDSMANDVSSEEASDSTQQNSSRRQRKAVKRKEDLRILIAEDDRINQQVLYKFCEGLGYKDIQVVGDGKSAVKKCSKRYFDVILMDKSMPSMNGMDAIQAIRDAQTSDRKSYIVLISGDSNIEYARYRSLSIDGRLVKPIRMPELKKELENVSPSVTTSKIH